MWEKKQKTRKTKKISTNRKKNEKTKKKEEVCGVGKATVFSPLLLEYC